MAQWSSLSSLLTPLLQVTGGRSSFSEFTLSAAVAVASTLREMAVTIHNKFGSADNIATFKEILDETQGNEGVGLGGMRTHGTGQLQSSPKFGSDDDCSNSTTGSPGGLPCCRGPLDHGQASGVALLNEIQELKDNQGHLEDCFENLKAYYQQNYTVITEALLEQRYRCDLLEEQLSDLTELHYSEIVNLKEELSSMEEVTYQFYDGATDIHEVLQACQTRLFKLEQQQVVQLERLENATVHTLLGKLINVLLTIMAVLLLIVSTVANCIVPLMKTYSRMFCMLLFVVLFSFLWRHRDSTSEYLHHLFCVTHPD
ncbi:transmembrane and coiled-coil domains protein 1 [Scomber scombrus]|uniref:Transmembrane and coiled-coil domains protein 1 n=1 Tax=Scomber scombrus TaxID=13677 RepID=A0AAV1NA61_SCOSC|nr:transmembrane and coiled-coil domains protein 1-like [Scomber scombrus]